jgi:LPS-assembly lipoprotein
MNNVQVSKQFRHIFWLIFFCACLSACGFHLRGSYNLPPQLQNIYVQSSQPFDSFIAKIKRSFKDSGIHLAPNVNQATYIFQLNDISQSSVLQASSTTNQISTYALNYTIRFTVTDGAGKVIIPSQSVTSTTTYTLNSTEAISTFTDQPQLLFGLQQDAIFQIMNRLSSNNAKQAFRSLCCKIS